MIMALLHPVYHWYQVPEILNVLQLFLEDNPNVSQLNARAKIKINDKDIDMAVLKNKCNVYSRTDRG